MIQARALLLVCLLSCSASQESTTEKINGLCLVAPPYEVSAEHYLPIVTTNANWVAIIPYAFCGPEHPMVKFDHDRQRHGETTEGISKAITLAHQSNLQVMLKPHLWVRGQGWAGDLKFEQEEDLAEWQQSYSAYVLHFAKLAQQLDVSMFSMGTEIRQIANSNPTYFKGLIKEIKQLYQGKLTYSANWDNYQNISFWGDLDYIGIDAYFPLSESKTPSVTELIANSQSLKTDIESFARSHLKKVLFTEYGFRSIDHCAAGHWQSKSEDASANLQGQANAYEALYQTYWSEDWFAGGFAWKWHYRYEQAGGPTNTAFTPQRKLAEKILRKRYSKY